MIVSRSSVTSDASDALSVMLETRLPSRVSRSSDGLTLFRAIGEALSIMINLYISVRCHNISLRPVFKRLLRMTDMSDARQMFSASPPLASPLAEDESALGIRISFGFAIFLKIEGKITISFFYSQSPFNIPQNGLLWFSLLSGAKGAIYRNLHNRSHDCCPYANASICYFLLGLSWYGVAQRIIQSINDFRIHAPICLITNIGQLGMKRRRYA